MNDAQWLTAMREDSGQKLAVRFRSPSAISDAQCKYTQLLVVTHRLTEVRTDGLPAPDYNDCLREFDCELIQCLDTEGKVILVETYAGERIYYAYVTNEVLAKERAEEIFTKHGQVPSSDFRGGPDPEWKFYERYSETVIGNYKTKTR